MGQHIQWHRPELAKKNQGQPLLILIITPGNILLSHIKMSAVKKAFAVVENGI